MCFGSEASFITAAVLAIVGVATLKIKLPKSFLPLSLIPFLFALQQAVEGFVRPSIGSPYVYLFSYIFLFFAILLWPVWIPLALTLPETKKLRKIGLILLLLLGISMDIFHLFNFSKESIDVRIVHYSIQYFRNNHSFYSYIYLTSTVLPLFLSSLKVMWVFGILNLLLYLVSVLFMEYAYISVWCFFAAISSICLYFLLRRISKDKKNYKA
jgi:hypothetical protein